jgi:DNA-binding MarR family transcriptional regulator
MEQRTTAATSGPTRLDPAQPAVTDLIGAIEAFGRAQREMGGLLARTVDMPRASIAILRYLHVTGPVQIGCIAQHLRVDLSVASRQTSALVDAGLVRRTVDDGDRRARTIGLTDEGNAAVATIRTHITHLLSEIFGAWDAEQIQATVHHISALAETVAAYAATPEHPPGPAQRRATDQNPQQAKDTDA